MKHGKNDKAFQSFLRLRAHPIISARDFYYSYVIYQEELKEARGAGYFDRLFDCFRVPRIRRANYGASTVMIAQQMCGINSELFLLPASTGSALMGSYLLLQFHHLHSSRLHRHPSAVRFARLWCRSGRLDHPDLVLDRYQGPKNALFDRTCTGRIPLHSCRADVQTFPLMCIFLLAAGLSLLKDYGSRGSQIGPVVL
jgi:hypothetical protein